MDRRQWLELVDFEEKSHQRMLRALREDVKDDENEEDENNDK